MNHTETYKGQEIVIREKPVASRAIGRSEKPTGHVAHDAFVDERNVSRRATFLGSTGEKMLEQINDLTDKEQL